MAKKLFIRELQKRESMSPLFSGFNFVSGGSSGKTQSAGGFGVMKSPSQASTSNNGVVNGRFSLFNLAAKSKPLDKPLDTTPKTMGVTVKMTEVFVPNTAVQPKPVDPPAMQVIPPSNNTSPDITIKISDEVFEIYGFPAPEKKAELPTDINSVYAFWGPDLPEPKNKAELPTDINSVYAFWGPDLGESTPD